MLCNERLGKRRVGLSEDLDRLGGDGDGHRVVVEQRPLILRNETRISGLL